MKNFAIIVFALSLLVGCKKNDSAPVPDPVMETPNDTIKRDTLAVNTTIESPHQLVEQEIAVVTADKKPVPVDYASFGSKFSAEKVLTKQQMLQKYKSMQKGDTLALKFKSRIADVCKKKGCWMKMDLAGADQSFVRFTDYGFFVPLNADNSEAIVSGRAYLDVITVDELKHYAKDGGESQEAIDKITTPKVTYAFQADGVLIAQ